MSFSAFTISKVINIVRSVWSIKIAHKKVQMKRRGYRLLAAHGDDHGSVDIRHAEPELEDRSGPRQSR